MTTKQKKQIWGEELFKVFAEHIDEKGWITSDWCEIIEDEIPQFDEDYNDNPIYKQTYQMMYNVEFEYNEDETKIRPIDLKKIDENMNIIGLFMEHYENETGEKIPEKIFLSFFNA